MCLQSKEAAAVLFVDGLLYLSVRLYAAATTFWCGFECVSSLREKENFLNINLTNNNNKVLFLFSICVNYILHIDRNVYSYSFDEFLDIHL